MGGIEMKVCSTQLLKEYSTQCAKGFALHHIFIYDMQEMPDGGEKNNADVTVSDEK